MSFLDAKLASLREQSDTLRAGLKWTKEEDEQLMIEILNGIDLDNVAKKHQRTVNGVKIRVMLNALNMMINKNLTIQDVSKLVNISVEDLEKYKNKQQQKKIKNIKKTSEEIYNANLSHHKDIMIILTEIRDYLKIISEK